MTTIPIDKDEYAAYLAAQEQAEADQAAILAKLLETWAAYISSQWAPTETTLLLWIRRFGICEVDLAIRLAAPKYHTRWIQGPIRDGIQRYIYGIMRRRAEEAAEAAEAAAADAAWVPI
jgi:hypothetical protein